MWWCESGHVTEHWFSVYWTWARDRLVLVLESVVIQCTSFLTTGAWYSTIVLRHLRQGKEYLILIFCYCGDKEPNKWSFEQKTLGKYERRDRTFLREKNQAINETFLIYLLIIDRISTHVDGGPRSQVCTSLTHPRQLAGACTPLGPTLLGHKRQMIEHFETYKTRDTTWGNEQNVEQSLHMN